MRLAGLLLAAAIASATPARAGELLVAAAASLTDALTEIGRAYEAKSGSTVRFDFGASSALARQIEAGAPVDVFFSADTAQMDALATAGLIAADTRVDLLSNALVVVVPERAMTTVTSAADVGRVARLALADPAAVPAGVYARTWLESAGAWEAAQPHVVPTADVRAALAAVEGEHADAAIVYRTDARIAPHVRVAFAVPRDAGPEIVYPVAVLAAAKPGARELVRHLAGPEARAVFERLGFVVLGGP